MPHFSFQKAEKVYFHDRILAASILKLFPRSVKPNYVTVFRFIATPFVVVLMVYGNYVIGLMAFLFTAFSDVIDGSLARTRDQITNWGKIYDPLADKILIGSMVFIIVLKYIDYWTAIIIIVLELIIITAAWIRKTEGRKIEANLWGKIKMCLQVSGVSILLLAVIFKWQGLLPFASGVLYLAIAFAVVSLLTHGI